AAKAAAVLAAPSFTIQTTTATPTTVSVGQGETITTNVTAGAAASGIIVDLEIYNSANTKVWQSVQSGQSFAAGATRSFSWSGPGISTPGTYTVKVGVFNSTWSKLYTWVNQAATFAVR